MPYATLPGTLPLTLLADPVSPYLPTVDIIPDTALTVIVTDAAGNTKTLDSHAPDPCDRPMGISFGSQQGSGFYTGSFTLSNPIDRERDDLHLRDKVQIIGANGDTAYEGFVTDLPRSTDSDGQGTLTVQVAGYMADAGRQTFRMPFVDRDFGSWQPASRTREVNLIAGAYSPRQFRTAPDATNGRGALILEIGETWTASDKPISLAVYDTGPNALVASLYYDFETTQSGGSWVLAIQARDTDDQSGALNQNSANLTAASGSGYYTPASAARFWELAHYFDAAGGAAGAVLLATFRDLAIYGNHGLPLIGDTNPKGVAASDVIRYLVDTYCPKLNTAGVQDTTYPIAHLTFRERTKVYDAIMRINNYHLWQFSVWEGGTVHYAPVDMSEWDWEIRHDEVGNQLALQGDSVENLRNGIIVSFTNVATGSVEELHPDDYPELRDESVDNPYNMHGDKAYGEPFPAPFPTIRDNALELGRMRLLEDNQVKAPGSFTAGPWIRDRSGQLQPVWKVRAGDRIRLTSSASLSDRPRLIHEVQYGHDGRSATVAVDSTLRYLESFVDRTMNALQAAGLGS